MFRILGLGILLGAFVLAAGFTSVEAGGKKKGKGKRDFSAIFKKIDANDNGKVSKDEYKAFLEKVVGRLKEKFGEEKAKKFMQFRLKAFEKADKSGEGLTMEEMKKAFRKGFRKGKKKKDG